MNKNGSKFSVFSPLFKRLIIITAVEKILPSAKTTWLMRWVELRQ
jgi:hypothetical protein